MARRDTIVVGASAGGVEALRTLAAGLPSDLPACVLIVLHTPRDGVNALAAILSRSSSMTVRPAAHESPLEHGTILVAQPDHHLVVVDGRVILTRGPRENGHRPAVDVLFRSAARALGPRVIGIVLSGALDDGAAGLATVRSRHGIGIVQDPQDALHQSMPVHAIRASDPEYVVPVAAMPDLLQKLVGSPVEEPDTEPEPADPQIAIAGLAESMLPALEEQGQLPALTCPDCYGVLFAIDEGGVIRYRCRVGHAWSVESLLAESDTALEGALWMALRSLEEKAALARDMAARADRRGQEISARRFAEHAAEATNAAELIRRMLLNGHGVTTRYDAMTRNDAASSRSGRHDDG